MVNDATEEFVTYENFYRLNKRFTSQSCVVETSGGSSFYDLDGVIKRKSYSCLTEEVGLSTFNIFRALNRKGDEWPRAPSEPVHIVQECITKIKPKPFNTYDNEEENSKRIKSVFLRECVLSSGICLKDCIDDSESSSPRNSRHVDNTDLNRVDKHYTTHQAEHHKYEGNKRNKKDHEKRIEDPCLCDLDGHGCPCKNKNTFTEEKNIKSHHNQVTSFKEEVFACTSSRNKAYLDKEEKIKCMSGDGLAEKYTLNLPKNDTSCILIMDSQDVSKVSRTQLSDPRKSGVRHVARVLTNRIRVKPQIKSHAIRCPNCNEHIEFTLTTEDEASTGVPPNTYRRSETAFTYVTSSKAKFHPKMDVPNECPHGCEMVPLCQILPKVNFNASSIKPNKTPRLIRMTKACRHYPPCTVVPSCQRNNVLKGICETVPPCCHRPRCVNLPLCIPFCKELQYDETTRNYVDNEEREESCYVSGFKYIPVSRLLQQHVTKTQAPNAYESRAYFVNQTHLPCQVLLQNTKQSEIATKSCQYDPQHKCTTNTTKEDANDASVVYIRDVGCQFKNSCFPRTSYFQTRVSYTSSASFDPTSKRVDNLYTNPNAVKCETLIVDPKSKDGVVTTPSISASAVGSLSSLHESGKKRSSKTRPEANTAPRIATFCMLRNGEGGYLVPNKPKKSSHKGKCKNKFTVQHRQISQVLDNFWSENL